jgi:hypothetical protein
MLGQLAKTKDAVGWPEYSRGRTPVYERKCSTLMSIQRDTLRLVQSTLKGTRLYKNVLVVLPTEHLLRGFLFERTLEKEMNRPGFVGGSNS